MKSLSEPNNLCNQASELVVLGSVSQLFLRVNVPFWINLYMFEESADHIV